MNSQATFGRPIGALLLAALLAACSGGATTLDGTSPMGNSVAVPNVVGDTQAAATADITAASLTLGTVTMMASATVASGDVISESPAAGVSVTAGSAVNLTVSSGPGDVTVPNVVGDTQAAATTAITSASLTVGNVSMASSATVVSGEVISESPAAGSSVAAGSAVDLTVSAGPAMDTVPNVVGDTQAAATTAITDAGLIVGTVTMASSATVASGDVISESPSAGSSVAAGSAVDLTVSSGTAMDTVPNVVGDTQAAATTAITGAGLTLGTVTMARSATVTSGDVISESPSAGSSVAAGSAVNLTVSTGPAMDTVPNVVGDTQAAATTAITGAGLTVGTVTTVSSATVTSGDVISESPSAGSSVAAGSAVNLNISSGPATSNVVDCNTAPTAFWVPILVNPIASSGPSGVYVVPCNSLTSTAVPLGGPSLTKEYSAGVGLALNSSGQVQETGMILATASDGNQYLYSLDLRNTSAVPAPVQASTTVIPTPATTWTHLGCEPFYYFQTNPADPTSLVDEFEVPGTSGDSCNSGMVVQMFPYNGGAAVTIPASVVGAVGESLLNNSSGVVSGFVGVDPSNNLAYYTLNASTLAISEAATPLATNVTPLDTEWVVSSPAQTEVVWQFADSSGNFHLYGINNLGQLVAKFDFPAIDTTGVQLIGSNLVTASHWFFTVPSGSSTLIYSMPWSPTLTSPLPSATLLTTISGGSNMLGASSGDGLLYYYSASSTALTVYSLSVSSGTVSTLGTIPAPNGGSMALDTSATYLTVNILGASGSAPSTEVIALSSFTPVSGLSEASSRFPLGGEFPSVGVSAACSYLLFLPLNTGVVQGAAAIFRESNYTGGASADSGATFDLLNVAAGTDAPFTVGAGGATYSVPANSYVDDAYASSCSMPSGPDIGVLGLVPANGSTTTGATVVMYDLLNHLMVPVSVPGASTSTTNVYPWSLAP